MCEEAKNSTKDRVDVVEVDNSVHRVSMTAASMFIFLSAFICFLY